MREDFYDYVKNEIKRIPNCITINVCSLRLKEEELLSHIRSKYNLELINFNQELSYEETGWEPVAESVKMLRDFRVYHYKVDNQFYLECVVHNNDLKQDYPYILEHLMVYSSDVNRNELISFVDHITDNLKNK